MKKRVLVLLMIIIILSLFLGCSEDSLHSLEQDYKMAEVTYSATSTFKEEEIIELYEYAEKMLAENITTEKMYEDEDIYNLLKKYIEMNCFPDWDSRELTVRLTSIMLTMNGHKDFMKANVELLKGLKE